MFLDDKIEINYNSFYRENNNIKLHNVIYIPTKKTTGNLLSNDNKFINNTTSPNSNQFTKLHNNNEFNKKSDR
jgi:hypothetical protein